MKFSWHKTGFLEIISLTVLLTWIESRYQHILNHLHPEWIMLGLAICLVWCIRHKLHLPFILLLLIAGMLLRGVLVLPCGLLSLLANEILIGSPPFGYFEKNIFLLTELVIEGWYAIQETLHGW